MATARIARDDVIAYFSGRKEQEIVCVPTAMEIISIRYPGPRTLPID